MKIGYFLFPEARRPETDKATLDEALDEARLAETLGADAIFLAEHHFDGNCAYVDPPAFAAALAMVTRRVSIGFAVLQASLYHPVRLAEQLSLLDNLSNGRLIIGLGKGSAVNTHEYAGFEIDPAEAEARFDEVEQILIKTWTGEAVSHRGRFWNFDIPMLRPRPFTKPHPLLVRAAHSDQSIQRQARSGRPALFAPKANATTRAGVAIFREQMAGAGFGRAAIADTLEQSWVWRHLLIADTDAEALDNLRYFRAMQDYRSLQSKKFMDTVRAASKVGEIPPGVLCGSPETVRAQLDDLPDLGIGGLLLTPRLGPMPSAIAQRSFALFMSEVAPHLSAGAEPAEDVAVPEFAHGV